MCIALLLIASLAGLLFGGVYALFFEGGWLAFLIAYWAGGTVSFLALSLALLLRRYRASDDTGVVRGLEREFSENASGLDLDEQVHSKENFGSHVVASEVTHLEWTGGNEAIRRLG